MTNPDTILVALPRTVAERYDAQDHRAQQKVSDYDVVSEACRVALALIHKQLLAQLNEERDKLRAELADLRHATTQVEPFTRSDVEAIRELVVAVDQMKLHYSESSPEHANTLWRRVMAANKVVAERLGIYPLRCGEFKPPADKAGATEGTKP